MRGSLLVLAAAVVSLVGCGGGESDTPDAGPSQQSPGHSTSGSSWTVMVYMLADNNLEAAGLADLQEMMQVGSGSNFNLVTLVDRASPGVQDDTNAPIGGLPDFTGGKYIKVSAGSLQQVQDLGEADMGSPATLSAFIEWAAKTAPADRYALVLWDHGGAWPRFGVDEGNGNSGLDIPAMKQGISDGMQKAGIKQFGFIGFDACLMSTLEVALGMRSYAEYLVASEELEPGHGWDYQSFRAAKDNPGINPLDLAKAVISGFYAQSQQQQDADAVTLSVTDLYALDPLVAAVKDLGAALAPKGAVAGKAQADALKFGDNPDPSRATNQVDLGDLVGKLGAADSSLSTQTAAVTTALGKAVLDIKNGSSKAKATGLSVYFPPNKSYYNAAYDQLTDSGDWRSFLKAFFGEGTSIANKPQFTDANHQGQFGFQGSDLALSGTLAAGSFSNIVGVTLSYGIVDQTNGVVLLIGDKPGALDSSGVASATWDVKMLKVSQGAAFDYGFLSVSNAQGGNQLVQIPLAYTPQGASTNQIIIFAVVLDPSGNELSRSYFAESNGAWSEITPGAGSTVQTIVQQVTISTGQSEWVTVSGNTTFDPTQALDISSIGLNAGTQVVLVLEATDFGGNSDYVSGAGTL